ncbi:Ig-like domain-containing protein, partial [Frankia sp. Cpl3]|nr:Ig-like domain-containing protein [Frankia sp. Cpl3]
MVIPVTVKEAEQLLPRGAIEAPENGAMIGGTATVTGWYLGPSGVATIEVLVDGEKKGEAVYGEVRPDILASYPDYNNPNAGFRYELDTS